MEQNTQTRSDQIEQVHLIMNQKPLEIRLKIPHERKTETDIYITKDMVVPPLIAIISKKLRIHRKIILHSTGAANYKALKIAALVQEKHGGSVVASVSTNTIKTTSFILPTKAGEQKERKEKNINGVQIELSYI